MSDISQRNEYARKVYSGYDSEAKESFVTEEATLKQFILCSKSHENILTTKASLEWGNTYSLFFDLAEQNLRGYLTDEEISIDNLEQRQTVFGRTIGLAGALAYLHDELYLRGINQQFQCYHLDLKPQNILVFKAERGGNDIWEISDFGISKIKRLSQGQAPQESDHHISILDQIVKPKIENMDPSSGIENARFGGTYAAPEAREVTDMVTRKSDVWSLACVLTLVLTFMDSQSLGIHPFQAAREEGRKHDWFFDSKAFKAGSHIEEILHSSVSTWLGNLVDKASKRSKSEGTAILKASQMLQGELLIRDQEQRLPAKEVERRLRNIQSCFTDQVASPSKSETLIAPIKPSGHWKLFHVPRPSHRPTNLWEERQFRLPEDINRCKFNHIGSYLGAVSNKVIVTISVIDIQRDRKSVPYTSATGKKWADSGLGSNYLCAELNSDYFGVCLPLAITIS